MKILGIRFCEVSTQAQALAECLDRLGLQRRQMPDGDCGEEGFSGAIFPTAGDDASWVEIWAANADMPAGTMLQIVVDDADAMATHARSNGLAPQGPMEAHGETIYFLKTPSGLALSFQSALAAN